MRIEHEVRATIQAPIDQVWAVLGSFDDLSWQPGITAGTLLGNAPPTVGSVREMQLPDGTTIRERLEALEPGRTFSYSFDGTLPLPVDSSHITVTATTADPMPDLATVVTWHGQFDVADDALGEAVEHANRDIVWPALIAALASHLGAAHTLDMTDPAQISHPITDAFPNPES